MKLQMFVVDAFAPRAFHGNQAAVCANQAVANRSLFKNPNLSRDQMQKIAMEMNFSETAFVKPVNDEDITKASIFDLSWFTPKTEVPLCGHATLATAHVIFNEYGNTCDQVQFNTKSGPLYCSRKDKKISMNFPAYSIEHMQPVPDTVQKLIKCLGDIEVEDVVYAPKAKKLLVNLKSSGEGPTNSHCVSFRNWLQNIKPNLQSMMQIHPDGDTVRGIILTAQANKHDIGSEGQTFHFISRYFAPWVGIAEDPATGSAHCVLCPYWNKVLNKSIMHAYQAYPGRGAEMVVEVLGDKVNLLGAATTVIDGVFTFEE